MNKNDPIQNEFNKHYETKHRFSVRHQLEPDRTYLRSFLD